MPMSRKRSENDKLGNTFKSQTLISNLSNNLTGGDSSKKNASFLPSTLQKKKSNARGAMKGGPTTRTRPSAKAILGHTSEDEEPPLSYD